MSRLRKTQPTGLLPGLLCLAGLLLVGCADKAAEPKATDTQTAALEEVLYKQIADADTHRGDWLAHGRTWSEQRFSPLTEINAENVSQLSLAWHLDLPDNRGQEATPLVVDGVIYTASAWNIVIAVDAATGTELWRYDPQVPKDWAVKACCDAVTRGVAYWEGKIFVGTLDGRLLALKAETGEPVWSKLTIDPDKAYTITGAPRVAKGKVFIGNGGAEFGVRGYMSAYDVDTGELIWRFYTVPGDPAKPFENDILAKAAETWHGDWWTLGGGGTAWDSMAYDPELNLLYIGVGNGSPWNPQIRSQGKGDNLFLSSIVAVDADTGKYAWHYQTTPGDGWDYTATQHMILAELELAGVQRQVIMQAPKNGFFYVLDRKTGELLSAKPFVPINWATHVDIDSGRPVLNPAAEYWKTGELAMVTPAFLGAHNWHPMSFSPDTGLVYLPAQEIAAPYLSDDQQPRKKMAVNLGLNTAITVLPDKADVIAFAKASTKGHLAAWDPVAQREVWRVQYPGAWNGGTLSTAGNLVFQGTAGGNLQAYSADKGEKLWEYAVQTGVVAPPISYEANGEQYLSVMVGWGGIYPLLTGPLAWDAGEPVNRSRLLTFKIGGTDQLPEVQEVARSLPDLSAQQLEPAKVAEGFLLYDRFCSTCHGSGAVGGGVVPDLRYSGFLAEPAGWQQVVVDGLLAKRGMAAFGTELNAAQTEAIRAYVIGRNHYARSIGDTQRISR